jgi:enterochelin esterase family protein
LTAARGGGPEARVHAPLDFEGRVELLTVESRALLGNALGDPHVRELAVYLPPQSRERRLPAIFALAGFGGRGQSWLETHPWRRGPVWRYDRAVATGEAPPAILVLPDCFTRLGGSQYLNSPAVGRYEDHVVLELVPLVDERYPVLAGARAVMGKSSGGFGALRLAMRHPDLFAACASISGDCDFELAYGGEILACLRGLVAHEMSPARFLERFLERPELDGDAHAVLNVIAMSACYSPAPGSPLGFDLPMDLETGERRPEVWRRWLEHDPLVAVERHADALRGLRLLHLECGLADEFHLQWGLRRLVRRLRELGVPCEHEEHPGGHRGIDHRYVLVFAKLAAALA